jgi:hypothetical protein
MKWKKIVRFGRSHFCSNFNLVRLPFLTRTEFFFTLKPSLERILMTYFNFLGNSPLNRYKILKLVSRSVGAKYDFFQISKFHISLTDSFLKILNISFEYTYRGLQMKKKVRHSLVKNGSFTGTKLLYSGLRPTWTISFDVWGPVSRPEEVISKICFRGFVLILFYDVNKKTGEFLVF